MQGLLHRRSGRLYSLLQRTHVIMKPAWSVAIGAALVAVMATAFAQHTTSRPATATGDAPPRQLNDGWVAGSLAEAGIDRGPIEAMTRSIRMHPDFNIHAVLIERNGRLVYE